MKIKVDLVLFELEQCNPTRECYAYRQPLCIEIPADVINCIIEDIWSNSSYATDEERIYELRLEIYSMLGNEVEFDNLEFFKNKRWHKEAGTEKKKS